MADFTVPEIFDISEGAQQAASAAMEIQELVAPEDATTTTDKNGNVYKRWSEAINIESAWRELTESGLTTFVIAYKVRAGMPNAHRRGWARHFLSYPVLMGQADEAAKKKYDFMNNKSIFALTTLLQAAGLAPKTGGLKAALLQHLFPYKVKDVPTMANTPLVGKAIIGNMCEQPNSSPKAKSPRRTDPESYLPDAPPVG
jgi:hypothetical protein